MSHFISAVIITHNEARNIARCLQSLAGVADEIIVVDSLSTDNTVEICRQSGVQVISQAWLGYGPQKNKGIAAAAHAYILSLDADEALDETLRTSILQVKQAGLQGLYRFTRLNNYYGRFIRHGLDYPDFKIRLFPKDQVGWNEDIVHENLLFKADLPTITLKGHLLHYTYYSIHGHIQKTNHYTSLTAELYYKKGKRASLFKILFSPAFTFFKGYFLKAGFLDGRHGFVVNTIHAFSSFARYVKLWELEKNDREK